MYYHDSCNSTDKQKALEDEQKMCKHELNSGIVYI